MDEFRTFSTIAAAIFLEAMPFLAVGSLLSAAIEVLVSRERLLRLVPRRAAAAIAVGAAAFKTFLPQSVFETLTGSVLLAVAGMMLLAVLLSVCSEADAFVAASFAGLPAAGQLAFVTLGPMVDLKLIGMYAVTFRRSLFVTLMVVPTVAVFVLSLVFHVLV